MSDSKLLIVLYTESNAHQFWAGYHGGHEEADEEFAVIAANHPGAVENARILVEEKIQYVAVGSV